MGSGISATLKDVHLPLLLLLSAQPFAARVSVPFKCPKTKRSTECEATPSWILELELAAHPMLSPMHKRPPAFYCRGVDDALSLGLKAGLASLTKQERLFAQNLAMRVVASRGCKRKKDDQRMKVRAAKLAAKLAFSKSAIERLGGQPMSEAEWWLGPKSGWRPLRSRNVPLFHEAVEAFTRRFTPIHTKQKRAIFSQLIAFDKKFRPHLTSLIGRIEMRNGHGPNDEACVVHLSAARLRCQTQRLLPVEMAHPAEAFSGTHFLRFALNTVQCNACHTEDSPRAHDKTDGVFGDLKVLGADGAKHLNARRTAFQKGAAALGQAAAKLAWQRL